VIDADWPLAYAKAAGSNCPACVLTFRSRLPDVDDQGFRIDPFFKPMSLPDAAARPDVKGDSSRSRTSSPSRADELAYDSADGVILAINIADTPPFGTLH
jgi:hypothetical protein